MIIGAFNIIALYIFLLREGKKFPDRSIIFQGNKQQGRKHMQIFFLQQVGSDRKK